jgi:transcriptional regulator with XRE-family HTH domain
MRFYAALDEARQRRGLQWRQVAQQAGVSASTLTRMSQGRRPDVDGLAALLKWSGLNAEAYMEAPAETPDAYINTAVAYLRADPNLDEKQADALASLLRGAWDIQPKTRR